jgi:hypothetical protein
MYKYCGEVEEEMEIELEDAPEWFLAKIKNLEISIKKLVLLKKPGRSEIILAWLKPNSSFYIKKHQLEDLDHWSIDSSPRSTLIAFQK